MVTGGPATGGWFVNVATTTVLLSVTGGATPSLTRIENLTVFVAPMIFTGAEIAHAGSIAETNDNLRIAAVTEEGIPMNV